MKLAWIGSPSEGGGVGGMCRLFLRELAQMPIELDVYANTQLSDVPQLRGLFDAPDKRFFSFLYEWNWNSWYGRNRQIAFVMSFLKRLPLHGRIVEALMAEHRRRAYDVVIQFSQGELLSLRAHTSDVRVLLFPCVHAAGELHWCRKEAALARRCEKLWWRVLRDCYLAFRARLQKQDYHRARGIIGMSQRFNRCVERDYGVARGRMGVVYHPIEVGEASSPLPSVQERIRLLFVGRISVRKGIDLLIQTIPALLAAHPDIEVAVIGAGSLWSDYEGLLKDLPTERCRWLKSLPNEQVTKEMQKADILLAPSFYEPGGIVVGEALACGMIVVASDEVGSAENLPSSVCKKFRAGDQEGFKTAVLAALTDVRKRGVELREKARRVASEQFDPASMTRMLLSEVERILANESKS